MALLAWHLLLGLANASVALLIAPRYWRLW